jgi:ParB-like chromosome segregation protein Spo0J
VAQIAASIREFGFCNPVLIDADGGIIAGHGRVLAARKLGLASVPCLRLSHLSETQRRAYILVDNKLALNAGWDDEMLRVELDALTGEGFDLSLAGFDELKPDDIDFEEKNKSSSGDLESCPKCGFKWEK